jgi:hypothetical protein
MILNTSNEAAKFVKNISGWVSRDGLFFGEDEQSARYQGCTHVACKYCGKPARKGWLACDECKEKRAIARYEALERVEWDQNGMLYSDTHDEFFSSWDEVEDFALDNGVCVADLQLLICEPKYLRRIDDDYWADNMPDDSDGTLPDDVLSALVEFNEVLRSAGPVCWIPGDKAPNINNG